MARRNTWLTYVPPTSPSRRRRLLLLGSARLGSHLGSMKEIVSGVSPQLVPHRFQTLTGLSCIIPRSQSATTTQLLYLQMPRLRVAIFMILRHRTHLGRLYFVSRTAAPPFEIWQHFTLLPVHAGMHLAPPLLCNYGGCGSKRGEGSTEAISDDGQQPEQQERSSA